MDRSSAEAVHWMGPGVVVGVLTLVVIGLGCGAALLVNGGDWAYPLDDTYIHCAIAGNLAEHGSWGLEPGEFQPASSSPVWGLLLAGTYALSVVSPWTPLAWNVVLAFVAALVVTRLLARTIRGRLGLVLGGVAVMLAVPVAPVAITALEHILHAVVYLAWVWWFLARLDDDAPRAAAWSTLALAGLLAAVNVGIRFESLFTIPVLCALGAWHRRWPVSIATGLGAVIALGAYSLWALSQGGQWLPNSVLLKGGGTDLSSGGAILEFVLRVPTTLVQPGKSHVTGLLVAAVALLLVRANRTRPDQRLAVRMLVVFVLVSVLHVQFADLGWFFRYEAYLLLTGVTALLVRLVGVLQAVSLPEAKDRPRLTRAAFLVGAVLLTVPLWARAAIAHAQIPLASRNIYEQQVQMARFVERFYADQPIAANDVGAVSFLGHGRVLDLLGLANTEIAVAHHEGSSDTAMIDRLTREHGTRMVVLNEGAFQGIGGLPDSWTLVGRWQVHDVVVLGCDTVCFYAPTEEQVAPLTANLRAFSSALPVRVTQSGPYVDPEK